MKQAMESAIASAREGVKKEEGGPFGAAIVHKGKFLCEAHNTVLKDGDPSCHAEMNAIRKAAKLLGTHILDECVLYTTAEPCPMCLGAIYWARIPKVIVGAPVACAARYGFDDRHFYEELAKPSSLRQIEWEEGFLKEACEQLFKEWQVEEGQLY